jgi:hypothetical protein
VNISDLRTDVEEIKWDNMRRAVGWCFLYSNPVCKAKLLLVSLAAFVVFIVISLELRPRPKPTTPPSQVMAQSHPLSAKDVKQPQPEGLEDWAT